LKDVQVAVSYASSRCGSSGLPISEYEKDMMDKDIPLSSARIKESDAYAVVGFLGGSIQRPICFGFLFPEENEILCGTDQKGNEDGTQFLWKHESNVYVRVAKGDKRYNDDGGSDPITPDIEISHPSGLYLKIGRNAGSGYPDYTSVLEPITNWDKEIRPFKKMNPKSDEADPAPFVHLYHPSGTYLTIDTEGSVTAYIVKDVGVTEGTLDQTVKQNVTQTFEADFDGTVKGDATESVEGDLTESVDGTLDKTITGAATEAYQSSLGKTVSGTETDDVTGAWNRSSSASIKDTAPVINHQ
jgi:hypothetical protein